MTTEMVTIKSERELALMKEAGRIVALGHQWIAENLRAGVTTAEIDLEVDRIIREHDALPAFKGYRGFPASTCTSVNEELVHGIPGDRILNDGDIISIDIGTNYKHYFGDSAWTYAVGTINPATQALLDTTRGSLEAAIEVIKPDIMLSAISRTVQEYSESRGCSVVKKYVGHGIGYEMHEPPQIPNFVSSFFKDDIELKPGMVLAIEPMLNAGGEEVHTLDDGWTVVTTDGSMSAHFEHTIAVTSSGCEVLTVL